MATGRVALAGWFTWLAAMGALAAGPFLWQVEYFKSPGIHFYWLFVSVLLCSPALAVVYQRVRRRWLWRYELAALAAFPVAAGLLYETRAALVTASVFLACFATGNALRKRWKLDTAGCLETIAVSSGIGFGILFCLLFVLGLAGQYRAWWFAILLAASGIAFRREFKDLLAALKACHAGWASTTRFAGLLGAVLTLFAAACACSATMVVLAPSLTFDTLWMHLPAVQYYASQHALRPVPNLDYSYFPQSVETLMTLGYTLGGQPASQMLHPVFFGLSLLVLFRMVRQCGADRFAAFTGVLAAASVPVLHWSGSVAKNDFALVFFLFAALQAYLSWRCSGQFRWIQLGVFFLAMAAGVKHIAIFALPAIGLLYSMAAWRQRRRVRAFASLMLIFAVFGLFWHARTFVLTGNPVYPEKLVRAVQGAVTYQVARPDWKVRALRYLTLPWNLHFHGALYFESPLPNPLGLFLVVFAPVWILTRKHGWNRAEQVCLVFALLYLAYWSTSIAALRYAIAPFALLFALTARRALVFHDSASGAARATVAAALAGSLLFALCGTLIIEVNGPQLSYFAGRLDRQGYLREALASYRSVEFLRSRAQPGDWLFGVGNCSAAYAPDPLRFDCMINRAERYAPEAVRLRINSGRYRYLILPAGPLEGAVMGAAAPLHRDRHFVVYSLASPQ